VQIVLNFCSFPINKQVMATVWK